jgi:hypothetical protein
MWRLPRGWRKEDIVRSLLLLVFGAWLCLASAAYAQDGSDAQAADESAQTDTPAPDDVVVPTGPVLQPSDAAPVVCDPNTRGFRYLEVRGTGFDAWATQHLVGNVVDGSGRSQMQWGSVWVSPQGGLTLEVNLCADPFLSRPALPAGDYTVSVGAGSGPAIAAASIALSPPPDPDADAANADADAAAADGTDTAQVMPTATATLAATPTATPVPFVLPNIQPQPTPTPLPPVRLPSGAASSIAGSTPTPAPQANNGPGSQQHPFPLGAPGLLADGWQLVVTGVTPDAWKGIHDALPSTIGPSSDQRDFEVRVQATFMGQGTGVFSGMRLALLSGLQTTYDQINNSCGTVPDMVPPNLMTPGGSTRGNVCFTVRASDVDSLVLVDNQSTVADRLYFALK